MKIIYTSKFKKDYKRLVKQNKDMNLLREVLEVLIKGGEAFRQISGP